MCVVPGISHHRMTKTYMISRLDVPTTGISILVYFISLLKNSKTIFNRVIYYHSDEQAKG